VLSRCWPKVSLGLVLCLTPAARAAEVKIILPLGRTAYQTNEWIDVSVVRSGTEALAKSELKLTLTGKDGSVATATFLVPAVPVKDRAARATEHLHVNGRLLRPGAYTVEAACDGASVVWGMVVLRGPVADAAGTNRPDAGAPPH
jgi:hypothetical protein